MGFWKSFKMAAGIATGLYVGRHVLGVAITAFFDAMADVGCKYLDKYELTKKTSDEEDESTTKEEES